MRRGHGPPVAAAVALAFCAGLVGCERQPGNFSQHAGFAEWFATHPPSKVAPGPSERALLERYRPRLMLPAGHPGPIDFYADYVAHGELRDGDGRLVSTAVTQEILNGYRRDPGAVFRYQPGRRPTTPTLYGRVDHETVPLWTARGEISEAFTFLTYHAVFATSGLPAELPSWQGRFLGLFFSLDDWHQLDHYTAAMLALDDAWRPVALTLQQHNHLHTYLLGADLDLPVDGRIRLDVAIRSNELYPHRQGRTRHRAVAMPTAAGMRYLMSGRRPPFLAADDVTDSAREVETRLDILPMGDAFYTFEGYLGERRWPPSRSGPPGADYNTRPAFKPRGTQMLAFYWRDDDPGDLGRLETSLGAVEPLLAYAQIEAPVFYARWQAARAARAPASAAAAGGSTETR
jgi:hypothetical protein